MRDDNWLEQDGHDPVAIAKLGVWCAAIYAGVVILEIVHACIG